MLPHSLEETPNFSSDFAHCRRVIREGSKSFYAASLLLPRHTRDAAFAVYAFCRLADDMVDLEERPGAALARLRFRLDAVYSGTPYPDPIDRAFAAVIREYRIPKALPLALLEGFAWDVEGRRYATLAELRDYAARVAGAVGAIMTMLMGAPTKEAAARACDLGVAMQLTNIARDVGEDARAGRIYLPLDWMEAAGLKPEDFLVAPVNDSRIRHVTAQLLAAAEPLYQSGLSGVSLLPRPHRRAILAAGMIYREIGDEIRSNGFDSVSQRAFVPTSRKLALLAKASSMTPEPASTAPPLRETRFLVDAVCANAASVMPPRPVGSRAHWVLDLFTRLEHRERAARAGL